MICNQQEEKTAAQIKDIFKLILPKGKSERVVFFTSFFFYIWYTLFFLYQTGVIDAPTMIYDLYYGFDNLLYFHSGGNSGCDSHPLLRFFLYPFLLFSDLLGGITYKAKGIIWMILCVSLVSSANVYVFRYLRQIIKIKLHQAVLLTSFFACFSTNLVLAFTTETYTISQSILLLFVLFFSFAIINDRKINIGTFVFASILTGGTTITNYAKIAVMYFFTNRKLRFKILAIGIMGIIMLGIMLVSMKTGDVSYKHRMGWRLVFTDPLRNQYDFITMVTDFLVGSGLLFAQSVVDIHNRLIQGPYTGYWQYAWLIVLFSGVILSTILNIKNKLFLLLAGTLGVDIFIHIVMKYNLPEGFIFGGHWVFMMPLILGWLYHKITPKQQTALTAVVAILFVPMIINNAYYLYDIFLKLQELYPPISA